jgi:hypothetical protein
MIVERSEFCNLCLLLRPELREADIPHRTTMQRRILDNFAETLQTMSQHILVSLNYHYHIFCLRANFYLEEQPWEGLFYHRYVV